MIKNYSKKLFVLDIVFHSILSFAIIGGFASLFLLRVFFIFFCGVILGLVLGFSKKPYYIGLLLLLWDTIVIGGIVGIFFGLGADIGNIFFEIGKLFGGVAIIVFLLVRFFGAFFNEFFQSHKSQ